VVGRGAFFFAVAVVIGVAPAPASTHVGVRAPQASLARPDVAPGLLPDDWFGRPPSPWPRRAWQQRKSPLVAMMSSFVVPGLGQLYNEREFWAVVAAGVEFYFVGTIVTEQRETNRLRAQVNADPENDRLRALFELHRDNRTQATWLLGLSILLSGLQSFVDAHLFDFDESPLPIEVGSLRRDGAAAGLRLRF
jgi:hypothetical protein